MLVTVKNTRVIEETLEIKLPRCSKDGKTFYRINEDESVLQVILFTDYAATTVSKPSDGRPAYHLSTALQYPECSAEEFEEAAKNTIDFMDTVLSLAN